MDRFKCFICGIKNEFVRFEGEIEGFICDKCLNDKSHLLDIVLNKLYTLNKKLSFKELKKEYFDYFDNINIFKTKKDLLRAIMIEEETYKIEYSQNELIDFIKDLKEYYKGVKNG